jgi:hypothetical protein
MPGNKFKIEFSAPENSPFPSKLYEKFKLHHGSMRMVSSNAIGWFSGKFTDTALYVTEIQSDLLQRTYELSEKYLDKNGYHADHPFRQFTQYKSKLENYYDGWLYVFAGTGLAMMLKNNPSIEKIFIPTSDYYENSVSRNSPYQYYDKLALLYPNAVLTEDGKFWEINRSDIYSENTNQKSMYDSIIKAAVVAGTKAQKEATPDLDSDRNLAFDVLNSLNDLGILSEYLNSNEGKKHLEEIREWITGRFLDEKPFTDDTPGGELQLVDPQGNPIDDEDMQEDEELEQLLRSSDKKIKLDVNQLLDDLQDALKAKDVNKQNFIKKLLDEANGYGNSDILYALSKPVDKPTESFDESDNSDPFC